MRAGKANLTDAYVLFKNDEAWLLGMHVTPLLQASTHVIAEPTRTRKLLMSRRQIDKLTGEVQQKGHTCVPLSLYWSHGRVKCEIALVKGKQQPFATKGSEGCTPSITPSDPSCPSRSP